MTQGLSSDQTLAPRQPKQFSFLNNLFGHGHGHGHDQVEPDGRTDSLPQERIRNAFGSDDSGENDLEDFLLTSVDLGSLTVVQQDCCLFIFLDGSAHYLDDFMREKTGEYQLQPGRINGFPHYASRKCRVPGRYSASCTYIWSHNGRWVVGDGRWIGQTKGVMYTESPGDCPDGLQHWRYLDTDLTWRDDGKLTVSCSS